MRPVDRDLLDALKVLAEPTRLRIWASLTEAPVGARALADALRIQRSALDRHLRLLVAAGLVGRRDEGPEPTFTARIEVLASLGRRLSALERDATDAALAGPDVEGLPAEDARIVRSFVHDGRLASIPAQDRKRRVILRWLVDRCFVDDRAYPEKEVNQRLALYHPDVASLRRYLVDGGLMTRDRGVYRRAAAGASTGPAG
jgi:hypothetical protein